MAPTKVVTGSGQIMYPRFADQMEGIKEWEKLKMSLKLTDIGKISRGVGLDIRLEVQFVHAKLKMRTTKYFSNYKHIDDI